MKIFFKFFLRSYLLDKIAHALVQFVFHLACRGCYTVNGRLVDEKLLQDELIKNIAFGLLRRCFALGNSLAVLFLYVATQDDIISNDCHYLVNDLWFLSG